MNIESLLQYRLNKKSYVITDYDLKIYKENREYLEKQGYNVIVVDMDKGEVPLDPFMSFNKKHIDVSVFALSIWITNFMKENLCPDFNYHEMQNFSFVSAFIQYLIDKKKRYSMDEFIQLVINACPNNILELDLMFFSLTECKARSYYLNYRTHESINQMKIAYRELVDTLEFLRSNIKKYVIEKNIIDLIEDDTAIFIKPSSDEKFNYTIGLFYEIAFTSIISKRADEVEKKKTIDREIVFYLDEFLSYGKISKLFMKILSSRFSRITPIFMTSRPDLLWKVYDNKEVGYDLIEKVVIIKS